MTPPPHPPACKVHFRTCLLPGLADPCYQRAALTSLWKMRGRQGDFFCRFSLLRSGVMAVAEASRAGPSVGCCWPSASSASLALSCTTTTLKSVLSASVFSHTQRWWQILQLGVLGNLSLVSSPVPPASFRHGCPLQAWSSVCFPTRL